MAKISDKRGMQLGNNTKIYVWNMYQDIKNENRKQFKTLERMELLWKI